MDIIFVNPPYEQIAKGFDCVRHISNQSPSLGLLHLAAQVIEDGFSCSIIECAIERLSIEETVEKILEHNPKFVGITLFTVGVHNANLIAKALKEKAPHITILVGGPHISSMGMETMERFQSFDIAVMNEGEITLSKLLPALKNNQDISNVEDIIYRDQNQLVQTTNRTIQIELDDLPLPSWHLLPNFPKGYPLTVFDYPKGPVATFSASRGCPFKCEFCDTSTFGAKIRYYSPQKVFEIMQYLQNTYGITHLQFVDDLFVASKKRILKLCELIIESNFKMTWSCTARVDSINPEILHQMKKAGCWEISYGLESGSDAMLKNMRKATKTEQARNAVQWTHDAGIRCKGLLMLGYPGEDESTIAQTKAFVKELPLTTMNLSKFTPYPGSPIYIKLYGTSMRDEDWDRMNGMNFIYEPEHVSMEKLHFEYRNILEGFYQRPQIAHHYVKMILRYPTHLMRLLKFGLCSFKAKYLKKAR
ncbi:B12-binding domain-containing radical SAM protein [Candidatus Marinarcus aquaticus]|nr:radical SAM protein [Candidatus Marinarcus aquaticus]